jgi:hypothetical protein
MVFKTITNLKKEFMRKEQITLLTLLIPVLFFSCNKETGDKLDEQEKFYRDNPEAIAQVKFVHAYTPLTINGLSTSLATTSTGFRITMDGIKINAAMNTSPSTNTIRYGGQPDTVTHTASFFPTTATYSFVPPGSHNFRFIMNRIVSGAYAPTTADQVFSSTVALTPGKKYTMFIADPYGPPATYMIEDNFQAPNRNTYGVRFVNLCADAASRFDVVSKRYGQLFSNVGYKEMKDFIYPGITTRDTVYLYSAGTNTIVSQINGFLPVTERVYTLYARGKTGTAGRTPSLTYYTNR